MDELEKIKKKKMYDLQKKMRETKMKENISEPIHVSDSNFDEIVKQYPFIIIDCWAPWCGPCQMIAPTIENLAKDYAGKVAFGKLNTDENPRITMRFNIMSIPTLLFIKNGKEVDRVIGAVPRQYIESEMKKYL
jgi:thioredoxin 1